jgi:deoxyribodipyrimidine photo-lyase
MTQPVIMWFRQDLRLADNAALSAAASAGPVICLYILDDETPGQWRWGGASRWWLHRSLESLSRSVPLVLRRGRADKVIAQVLHETRAAALYFARDYAPWSAKLEANVNAACIEAGVACRRFGGFLLHEPEDIRTGAGEPYKVYTPFSRACFAKGDPKPARPAPKLESWTGAVAGDALADWHLLPAKPNWAKPFETEWQPGETGAKMRLQNFLDDGLAGYVDGRDRPDLAFTSKLAPHLHWGEISPAQFWQAVRGAMARASGKLDQAGEKFLKEMLWREFCHHLIHHWPDFPEKPFRAEFADFPWAPDKTHLKAWQRGLTGYPIVDAGMRELWTTGFMHNRVRMIAASFLIKDLLIPWQEGERWFWDTLVDADIGNNAANWQWVAGCGADAAPYFRIFNPILQGQKFDPDGAYVRRFLPELAKLPARLIHSPWQASPMELADAGIVLGETYPLPMIDHNFARDRALEAFKRLKKDPI